METNYEFGKPFADKRCPDPGRATGAAVLNGFLGVKKIDVWQAFVGFDRATWIRSLNRRSTLLSDRLGVLAIAASTLSVSARQAAVVRVLRAQPDQPLQFLIRLADRVPCAEILLRTRLWRPSGRELGAGRPVPTLGRDHAVPDLPVLRETLLHHWKRCAEPFLGRGSARSCPRPTESPTGPCRGNHAAGL